MRRSRLRRQVHFRHRGHRNKRGRQQKRVDMAWAVGFAAAQLSWIEGQIYERPYPALGEVYLQSGDFLDGDEAEAEDDEA